MSALLEDSTAALQAVQAVLNYTLDTGRGPPSRRSIEIRAMIFW